MKFRNKSFFIDILNKVKEKMLYPLKLIPVLKSNITIISIGVVSLFIFFYCSSWLMVLFHRYIKDCSKSVAFYCSYVLCLYKYAILVSI